MGYYLFVETLLASLEVTIFLGLAYFGRFFCFGFPVIFAIWRSIERMLVQRVGGVKLVDMLLCDLSH